ncbi:MAG: hypothetical protein H0U39_08325 [Segetibacter sp.]|nr:hypothetical protein [Segetibacter sp.]
MNRRDFVNRFMIAPPVLAAGKGIVNKDISALSPENSSFSNSFVRISKKNPFYFELSNGDPYIVQAHVSPVLQIWKQCTLILKS